MKHAMRALHIFLAIVLVGLIISAFSEGFRQGVRATIAGIVSPRLQVD